MTFSDPKVAALVNAHFVSAWYNRGPGFHNEDFSTENWIFTSAMEAYTTKNICTFFLAPDGKVFHYVCGYYSPDVFLTYLQVALQVRSAAFDERMELKAGGLEGLRNINAEVLKTIDATEKEINDRLQAADGWKKVLSDYDTFSYRSVKHTHTAACARNLHEGYRYLKVLHKWWSEAKELPPLEKVQFDYLWGNPFTEESPGAKQIGGDGPLPVRRCGACDELIEK